ncbi:MAG: class I SAM-dependent methyltransferase [Candidatus Omnitrophica bacterium]|nr:class I SAM-dependent methyltransferase [Candidatus Omnitrophota bacterium]
MLQQLEKVLNRSGVSFFGSREFLDFGCGTGRLAQLFSGYMPDAKLYGCDVKSYLVKRCARLVPRGNFFVNGVVPPLDLEDGSVDMVFAYSVFTHLKEDAHIQWLREFSRVLKKGGYAVLTTHGYECLKRMRKFSPEKLKKYQIEDLDNFMVRKEQYYWVQNLRKEPDYGLAVITDKYIRDNWMKVSGMELKGYEPAAVEAYPEGCQDLVILIKGNG